MWPLRVYTRKKRAGQRLNLTPTPDLGSSAPAEARAGPGGRLAAHRKLGGAGLPAVEERGGGVGEGRVPGCPRDP